MVLTDGAGPGKGRRSNVGVGLLVVAAMALVGGLIALGGLTTPDPAAFATTTTIDQATTTSSSGTTTTEAATPATVDVSTFSVADIAQGESFQFELTMAIDEGYPIALEEHGGQFFLFSSEIAEWPTAAVGGLTGWSSPDGLNWTPLGQVIEPSEMITQVLSTGQGLVALGTEGAGAAFSIWRSQDGVTWDQEEVAVPGVNDLMTVMPYGFGGNEAITLVSVTAGFDVNQRLADLPDFQIDSERYGWSTELRTNPDGEDDVAFALYGPFGFPMAELTSEEAGLTPEERDLVIESLTGSANQLLRSSGDGLWEPVTIPDADWIELISTDPSRRLVVFGYTSTGPRMWTSFDGVTWEERSAWQNPSVVDTWGEQLVGPSGDGRAAILTSTDGVTWDEMSFAELLPDPIQWFLGTVSAGPGGVAAQVNGWHETIGQMRPEPVQIVDPSGTEVSLDFNSGTIEVETPDGPSRFSMYTAIPERIVVDLATGKIELRDRDGETLAVLDFEQVSEAEEEFWRGTDVLSGRSGFDVFAFTEDGLTWTIQDHHEVAQDNYFPLMEVTDKRVITVGISADYFAGTNSDTPGFEVWSAPIP